jgi:hypothetical protein
MHDEGARQNWRMNVHSASKAESEFFINQTFFSSRRRREAKRLEMKRAILVFMVRGDYYGRRFKSTLAIVFDVGSPQPGLWLYDGYTATFTMISNLIPDSNT